MQNERVERALTTAPSNVLCGVTGMRGGVVFEVSGPLWISDDLSEHSLYRVGLGCGPGIELGE